MPERPPRKWFEKLSKIAKQTYPRKVGESIEHYNKAINRIVAGIWHKEYSAPVKERLSRRYERLDPELVSVKDLELLANELERTYNALEPMCTVWRKAKYPDYKIRALAEAQEVILTAKNRVRALIAEILNP